METTIVGECKPCTRCNAKYVPPHYYIPEKLICQCCDQILKGGTRQCNTCNETKDITLFERPSLTRCKQCACKASKSKYQTCTEFITCECGTSIKRRSKWYHLKTKKHADLMAEQDEPIIHCPFYYD